MDHATYAYRPPIDWAYEAPQPISTRHTCQKDGLALMSRVKNSVNLLAVYVHHVDLVDLPCDDGIRYATGLGWATGA